MTNVRGFRSRLRIGAALLPAILSASAFGQSSNQGSRPASEASSLVKLDADLDDDGIMDAVTTLSLLKPTIAMNSKAQSDVLKKDFSADFQGLQRTHVRNARSACFDYMMLSPEGKERVNQRVQSKTLGMFGTRPCDPFVSPVLARPYDDAYVEFPLWLQVASIILR